MNRAGVLDQEGAGGPVGNRGEGIIVLRRLYMRIDARLQIALETRPLAVKVEERDAPVGRDRKDRG